MAYDEVLTQRIRSLLIDQPELVEKKMFGGVAFMLRGNMACGVNQEDLIVRVGPDAYQQEVMQPNVRPFDFTGRPMKGWVMVGPKGYSADEDLQNWVEKGVSFALSLPAK